VRSIIQRPAATSASGQLNRGLEGCFVLRRGPALNPDEPDHLKDSETVQQGDATVTTKWDLTR